MTTDRQQIQTRIAELMEDLMGIDASQVQPESSPDSIPQWDSLKHVSLIAALEEEFGFAFEAEEMSEMLNVDIILDIIEERLAKM